MPTSHFLQVSSLSCQVSSLPYQVTSQVSSLSGKSQFKPRVHFITNCVGSRIRYYNAINVPQVFTTVSRATEVVIYLTGLNIINVATT